MDPALYRLMESGSAEDEVSVIVRLHEPSRIPANIRVVARFGTIVTARVRRGDIKGVWESPETISVKAPRLLSWPEPIDESEGESDGADAAAVPTPDPPPRPYPETGKGVVVGMCDWGFDFTHPNLRNADGSTRLRSLWDQGSAKGPPPPGLDYGRLFTRAEIDAALGQPDPFVALGYHPASGDPGGTGSHGTHVADIMAGNRRAPRSEVGLASGSEFVFVHLAEERLGGLANFGDSVRLLEGIDFVRREAGEGPCVIHLSAGKTGGAHRGETPFEQAIDSLLLARPNIALCQSTGNYANAAMHTHARVGPDQSLVLVWLVQPGHGIQNELEVWYSGQDVFEATLLAPNGAEFAVTLDAHTKLTHGDVDWGSFHHRLNEPNSGLNHIDIFLRREAPAGRWRLALRGREVVDGRLHAWIERDSRGRYQSRFLRSQATSLYTTNTICNGFRAVAVGAYDATRADRAPTLFSSRGPTADGRQKPELVAPGYRIRAARSTPMAGAPGLPRLTVKSGTSMAAPWVSGTVALMFEAAGRPLTINEVRSLLIGTADPIPGPPGPKSSTRLGYGYLNTEAAVAAARRITADMPVAAGDVASAVRAHGPSKPAVLPPGIAPVGPAANGDAPPPRVAHEFAFAPEAGDDDEDSIPELDDLGEASGEAMHPGYPVSLEDLQEALAALEE